MNKTKGFTLIELLVVIAIIGILSSVVLASLNTARAKGADAAVKSQLSQIRSQAEIVYDGASPNAYTTVCADPVVTQALAGAKNSSGAADATIVALATVGTATAVTCHSSAAGYAVVSPLRGGNYWCVDSSGASVSQTAVLPANEVDCTYP